MQSASGARSRDGWDAYRNVLALRRLGFSVEEMRQMTTADFIAITDVACERPDKAGADAPSIRDATQADIDLFLG